MTHATKLSEVEQLQHSIDVYSALCMAVADNPSPDVVRDRTKLEGSIAEARELLAKIKAQS